MPNEHGETTQNQLGGIALNALEVGAFKKIIQKHHDATDSSSKEHGHRKGERLRKPSSVSWRYY